MKNTTVGFKTNPLIAQLIEKEAQKKGMDKSSFLTKTILDSLLPYERARAIGTLSDFLDIALPSMVSQGMGKDIVKEFAEHLKRLHSVYIRERIDPHMRLQRHMTNSAIESFLEGKEIEETGREGFIIKQCLQTIYDKLFVNDLITLEEWEGHKQQYRLYMEQGEGHKLLKTE